MDEETFRAIARSSPWLWSSMQLTRTMVGSSGGTVRAWVRRPGRMRVEEPDGRRHTIDETDPRGTGRVVVVAATDGDPAAEPGVQPPRPTGYAPLSTLDAQLPAAYSAEPVALAPQPETCYPLDPWAPPPVRRADGLVADRPSDVDVTYDDPMYENYHWVAMLDPVELADGSPPVDADPEADADAGGRSSRWRALDVLDLTQTTRAGRATVEATVRPTDAYDPRCSCCALLMGEVVAGILRAEGAPAPPRRYPDAFRVALDMATGVCVGTRDVGGDEDGTGFDVTIDEVTLVGR